MRSEPTVIAITVALAAKTTSATIIGASRMKRGMQMAAIMKRAARIKGGIMVASWWCNGDVGLEAGRGVVDKVVGLKADRVHFVTRPSVTRTTRTHVGYECFEWYVGCHIKR